MKRTKSKPLIIWRKNCLYCEVPGGVSPLPSLIVLANQEGFAWLSNMFAKAARKAPKYFKGDLSDPDNHMQIDTSFEHFNQKLSDDMAMRLGIITAENQKEVFEKYSIISSPPYKGDLVTQYKRQMKRVKTQWKHVRTMLSNEPSKKKRNKAVKAAGWVSFRCHL